MSKSGASDHTTPEHDVIGAPTSEPCRTPIPENWDVLRIGEMFSRRIERGREGLPVMSITMTQGLVERDSVERRVDTNLSPEAHLLVRAGDLAYNMMRMWQGVLGRGRFDCLVSPAYIVLQPKERVDPEFAEYLFSTRTAIAAFKRLSYGVVDDRLRLYYRDLVRISFALPRGRQEQHRIAEILSTLDETIAQTEALIAKYQQIKAGLMQDCFTRGITPDGRLRPTRTRCPHLFKESRFGWIPQEWGVSDVRNRGSVQLGRQRSPDQFSGIWTTRYLRVANVFDGFINYRDVLTMDFTPDERKTFGIKRGDILLNEGQSLELVGRSALFDGPDDTFCFQNTLVRFRCFSRQHPLFYQFLFKWFLDSGFFMRIAKQTTSVAHLGADRFARMPCPSVPYEEQCRIAERLSAIEIMRDIETLQLAKLRCLRDGLMHDLLTGRVRVQVEKSEEVPA